MKVEYLCSAFKPSIWFYDAEKDEETKLKLILMPQARRSRHTIIARVPHIVTFGEAHPEDFDWLAAFDPMLAWAHCITSINRFGHIIVCARRSIGDGGVIFC